MRKIVAGDLFPMADILSKIGVGRLSGCLSEELSGPEAGLMAAEILLGGLKNCQEELLAFLADIAETDKESLKAAPPAVLAEMILELLKKEELGDFFRVLSGSLFAA